MTTDAHDREYHAAVSGLHEQTVSPRRWRAGDVVRVPRAFHAGYQIGTVYGTENDRRVGLLYLVDTQEGRLRILPDEIEAV
jgi:hypothetical protein